VREVPFHHVRCEDLRDTLWAVLAEFPVHR
jgi:hypothetical protein